MNLKLEVIRINEDVIATSCESLGADWSPRSYKAGDVDHLLKTEGNIRANWQEGGPIGNDGQPIYNIVDGIPSYDIYGRCLEAGEWYHYKDNEAEFIKCNNPLHQHEAQS